MNKLQLKQFFKNPAIFYLLSRYGTYIIQFVNSLFIAIYLGPYYLGIWGFLNLIIGYLAQLNLGIPNSVNVIVSVNMQKEVYIKNIIGNGVFMSIILVILTVLFFLLNSIFHWNIGDKYDFGTYVIPACFIAVLSHFNSLFSNIFRIYGKIGLIALYQSLHPLIVLLLIPFFRGKELLWAILIANCASVFLAFLLFIIKRPITFTPKNDLTLIRYIQKRGWHLFVYSSSFYLILLTTKTFISGKYSVEEFGYFIFSYSLANAVLLLLNSISYLIFPKMLNRFANASNEHVQQILKTVRLGYISLSHLLIHTIIMLFPLFLVLFPQYHSASEVFKITALTVVLYTNSFGYQGFLMARGHEKQIGQIAFGALLLNILLCYILVFVFRVQFTFVMVATMITYFIYVFVLGMYGRNKMELTANVTRTMQDIFPLRMILPFMLSLLFVLFKLPNMFFICPFIVYLLLNFSELKGVKSIVYKVIKNPNFVNI